LWFGAVVPKRHARRAVTRTLVKRQIRVAVLTHAEALAAGLWVVRLRAAFDPASYVSASSVSLRLAVRDELDRLLVRCSAPATVG
jgi:ribonuclease P protein component